MQIIINADDFGLSKDVNEAIDICIKKDYIQRTTLMVNMPQTLEAVKLAKDGRYLAQVGLHINLIEGIPLTSDIKKTELCNENGEFKGDFFKNNKNRIWLTKKEKHAVNKEIESQIKEYKELGFPINHLDSHQHSHVNISVLFIVLKLAKKYGFKSIRISRNIPQNEIKGIKKIYKDFVNRKIISFNKTFSHQCESQFFGSKRDFEIENIYNKKEYENATIEMMVHPVIRDGMIVDNFTGLKLFDKN